MCPEPTFRNGQYVAPKTICAGERELLEVFASALNDCGFCHGAHRATAVAYGIDGDIIEVLVTDIESAPVEERMKPVYRNVWKLTLNPAQMVQQDVDAVFEDGW